MLQAKELRFGNKVQTRQGEVVTIQEIHAHSVVYDTIVKVNREMVAAGEAYRTTYSTRVIEMVKETNFHDLRPIDLTPKVLGKCGMRNYVRDEWILSIGKMHLDFEFTGEGLTMKPPYPCRISIQYLHQLQNLLFAVTGQELQVEL